MGTDKTSGSTTSGTGSGAGADNTVGSGRSGEGADSALEAMLRKRQTHVDVPPDSDAAKSSRQHDGDAAKE